MSQLNLWVNSQIGLQLDLKYFQSYLKAISKTNLVNNLESIDKYKSELGFDFAVSSVYSSNIEGNPMDLNSYFNYDPKVKASHEKQEIDELVLSYVFAKENPLNYKNLLKAHRILSQSFLEEFQQGYIRTNSVGVFGSLGLVYLALESEKVEEELKSLIKETKLLIKSNLSLPEIFYYASFLHLRLAHIHPFADGNGRTARLVEKWFLASKLGETGWKIRSEQYYKENQKEYYTNINLGSNFYELDYTNSIPFLTMLTNSTAFLG